MLITEGVHSIQVVRADESDQIKVVQLTRNEDCENAVLFINNNVFKLTAFINAAGEPQLRITDMTEGFTITGDHALGWRLCLKV